MVFYIINLFALSIVVYLNRKKRVRVCKIIFIWLFLVAALRGSGVGADYYSYKRYYTAFSNMEFHDILRFSMEKGYILLNKFIGTFKLDYQWLLAICSFMSLFGVVLFINDNSEFIATSLWLYICMGYYQSTFNRLREAIAISFVLIAYRYVTEKNLKRFLLFIFIAAMFHYTALVALLIYPLMQIKIKRQYIIFLIGMLVLVFIFRERLFNLAVNISKLFGYIDRYFGRDMSGEGGNLLVVYSLLFIIISLLIFLYSTSEKERYKDILSSNQMIYICSILTVVFQTLALTFAILNRIAAYFAIPMFILLPNLIKQRFEVKSQFAIRLAIMSISLIYYIYIMSLGTSGTIPYTSIINIWD